MHNCDEVIKSAHMWLKPLFENAGLGSYVTNSSRFMADMLICLDGSFDGKLFNATCELHLQARALVEGRSGLLSVCFTKCYQARSGKQLFKTGPPNLATPWSPALKFAPR